MLYLRLLGPLRLSEAGRARALPASRKTRALLAYLAATCRPHRRDWLCELFWSEVEDPRGALRWSLSRIRRALCTDEGGCLQTDHECAWLNPERIEVDLVRVQATLDQSAECLPTPILEAMQGAFAGHFLTDLDLPDCPIFRAWTVAMRDDVRQMQADVLATLTRRLNAKAALPFARELARIMPSSGAAWVTLLRLLIKTGRREECEAQFALARRALAADQDSSDRLRRVWLEARDMGCLSSAEAQPRTSAPRQEIRFCVADDGVRLAYAQSGTGPPLVKPANWMTHLEFDWESPVWRHWMRELSGDRTLIRFDERANGLSDWQVADVSFEACMRDLEAIVRATGLNRFPILGVSQGCAFAIAYAARHPRRVSKLILYGGYARGWAMRGDSPAGACRAAMETLIEHGWGQDNPAFRQMFTTLFVPDATPEQMRWFNDLQRATASPANALRLHHTFGQIDVEALLARVTAPTLVLHCREDQVVPFHEGRRMALGMPHARFVPLEGRNHILLEGEPAWARFLLEMRAFLCEGE